MKLCGSSLDEACGSWNPFTRSGSANLDLGSFVRLTGANGTFTLLLSEKTSHTHSLTHTHTHTHTQKSSSPGQHLITMVRLQPEVRPATVSPIEWDAYQIQICGRSMAAPLLLKDLSASKGGQILLEPVCKVCIRLVPYNSLSKDFDIFT